MRQIAEGHSDTTRLVKTKSAIRQLKADVKAMDVLIGIKSATVQRKRLEKEQRGESVLELAAHIARIDHRSPLSGLGLFREDLCRPYLTFPDGGRTISHDLAHVS